MLGIWPELPIYIHDSGHRSKKARDDVDAALRLNHRVSGIRFERKSSYRPRRDTINQLQYPFPGLTHLWVDQPFLTISQPLLGGAAPGLRDLVLIGVSSRALPELLLSTTNLVHLQYDNIPPFGYISPKDLSTCLPALTRLESLSLTLGSPRDLPDKAFRVPPPDTRTLLPALTYLRLQGDPEYVEDLVAQIDSPLLESMAITLFHFHREVLEVSELAKFVRRADKLSLVDRAQVTFGSHDISVVLSQELLVHTVDRRTLILQLACAERDLLLSRLVQFCASCLPTLSPFEHLHIPVPHCYSWQSRYVIDDPDPRWLQLLQLFNSVKDFRLSKTIALRVAKALGGLPVERVSEVLPALEAVFISRLESFAPMKDAISEFAAARQHSGHPVSFCNWDTA